MVQTKTDNLVMAQVISDGIKAELGKIKFQPVAYTQNFSNQQVGTITVPAYEYIGDADIVAEGVAIDPVLLSQKSENLEIKKAGKAVEITDEALKGGIGNPHEEAQNQLSASVVARIEEDLAEALDKATLTAGGDADVFGIIEAQAMFGENADQPFTVFANTSLMARFEASKVQHKVDFDIIYSTRLPKDTFYLVQEGGLGLYLAKDVEVETQRDILAKTNVYSADALYATHLRDASKVVKCKAVPRKDKEEEA